MAAYGSTYDSGDPSTQYNPNGPNQAEGTNGVYHDAQGRAFVSQGPNGTGTRRYITTYQAEQIAHDRSGYFTSGEWNPDTGQYETKVNWGNIVGLAAAAVPAAAGGAAIAGAAGAGSAIPAAGTYAGDFASTGTGIAASGAGAAAGAGAAGTAGAVLPSTGFMGAASGFPTAGAGITSAGLGTGGGVLSTLNRAGQTASDLGDDFSQGAAGEAAGRRADANANISSTAANNRANLDAATFNLNTPTTRARQVSRGDAMSYNYQPAGHTGSGRDLQFTGGYGPWAYGQDTTDAGNALKRQALNHLISGDDKLTPQMSNPTQPSATENGLAGVGLGLNVLGTLAKLKWGR